VAFCQWVTTFERGRIVENCGYEAEPVTTIEGLDALGAAAIVEEVAA